MGMPDPIYKPFQKLISLPHGIVLVTGPTGSGKSTTLYSALNEIRSPNTKVITVEDPVEYQLDGISQIQVHSRIGLTFAAGLRSILRHDPDVILIGEIRDYETAEAAIQASLTGHLVFSTLHTNDAASAFTRLVDMGVEPYLVASTVEGVMAQRLVRRLCSNCKEAYRPDPGELPKDFPACDVEQLYRPIGCRRAREFDEDSQVRHRAWHADAATVWMAPCDQRNHQRRRRYPHHQGRHGLGRLPVTGSYPDDGCHCRLVRQ
jgi:type II secretory ATPase GspE/PulE/Tfp pilus assembly ATPase PilB-like protein